MLACEPVINGCALQAVLHAAACRRCVLRGPLSWRCSRPTRPRAGSSRKAAQMAPAFRLAALHAPGPSRPSPWPSLQTWLGAKIDTFRLCTAPLIVSKFMHVVHQFPLQGLPLTIMRATPVNHELTMFVPDLGSGRMQHPYRASQPGTGQSMHACARMAIMCAYWSRFKSSFSGVTISPTPADGGAILELDDLHNIAFVDSSVTGLLLSATQSLASGTDACEHHAYQNRTSHAIFVIIKNICYNI